MAKKKKKDDRAPAPVETGYDERCRKRGKGDSPWERESDAPDGVSGNWS